MSSPTNKVILSCLSPIFFLFCEAEAVKEEDEGTVVADKGMRVKCD